MDSRAAMLACVVPLCSAAIVVATDIIEIAADLTPMSLVTVPVLVNSRGPYRFVVDTGATTTTLDDSVATELGLTAAGTLRMVTAAGAFVAPTGIIQELTVGSVRAAFLRVSWTPLAELRREDMRVAGVIGQDVLARHVVTIDYRRGWLRLGDKGCARGDTTVPVEWADGRPAVRAHVRAPGAPSAERLVLDSATNLMILFAASERRSSATAVVRTHRGAAAAQILPRAQITIGGLEVTGPVVVVSPGERRNEDGLLPTSWLSRVCIDAPRSQAVLTR